ncbi:hypothetical protein D3C87_1721110 [compost metagenome]
MPNADVVSNNMGKKLRSSIAESTMATNMIRNKASHVWVTALIMESFASLLWKSTMSSFPLIMANMAPIRTANTVTLMPPPVEPGAAPMNIRMINKNWVECSISVTFKVLTPPERELIDWNKELRILPPSPSGCIVNSLLRSMI